MALRLGQVAHPVDDRWNRRMVPKLGGVAILVGLLAGLATGGWAHGAGLVTLMGTLMFVVGLADDLRPVRPATKLVFQTAVAALFVYFAPAVSITNVPVIDTSQRCSGSSGSNAFMLDNGRACGGLGAIAAAAAGARCCQAIRRRCLVYAAGGSVGFLFFNFPASIFMGDAGSHLLGGTIANATLLATGQLKARAITAGAVRSRCSSFRSPTRRS
jgi:UDP-GlcNAc:undecaprenyl-phosphate GlcNAc-1-phosphate transferase